VTRYVFNTADTIRYRLPTHTNDLVMDRAEAETSEAFVVTLEPGESTPLHVHHDTEQVFYGLEGAGTLQVGEARECYPVNPGDLVRIPPHTLHRIACAGPQRMRYLCVDAFVGGRPKDEPTWDIHMRTVCEMNGWDFGSVRLDTA
jgi:quercetin dioxygenase-like cupin family protein